MNILQTLLLLSILSISCLACNTPTEPSTQEQAASSPATTPTADSSKSTENVVFNRYKDGKKDGLWREFDKEGRLSAEGYYRNGKANGLMTWYYEGQFAATGNMVNDRRHGSWKICDIDNLTNCLDAYFEDDKRSGTWKIYHDDGQLYSEQQWLDDKMVSEQCWDKNGVSTECKS